MTRTPPVMTQSLPIEDGQDMGVPPLGSGHQPSASAADASSRSGVPNADIAIAINAHDRHVLAQDISNFWTDPEERAVAYQAAAEAIKCVSQTMLAAPLLLEALEELHGLFDFDEPGSDDKPWCFDDWTAINAAFAKARAAISSARGGQ